MNKPAEATIAPPEPAVADPALAAAAPKRPRRHVISMLVKNVPGLLAQVANLFAARGYNIESLAVGETEDEHFSRMTITVRAEPDIIEALKQGLRRFVNVIKVLDFTTVDHIELDLALVKINTPAGARQEILELVQVFRGNVVDIGLKDVMISVVGPETKIDTFLNIVRPYGIKEMARTGRLAMARGSAMEGHETE